MAMHMLRKFGLHFLRSTLSRQQVTRQISALAYRGILTTGTINRQSLFVKNYLVVRPAVISQVKCFSDAPQLSAAELEQRTLEVIKSFDKVDPEKVLVDAHFINDMGLDSLDIVDILMAFEDEFGVEISDEQAEKIFTPKEAIEFMKTFLDIHDH